MNDKQHASMLALKREKGALEMKLDSLKEENDSLRARTRNMLLNSQESENVLKAQKAAESVLHVRDREGLEEEMQALRLQTSVAFQQLKDKNQAMRLAADEVSSLRDQMTFLTAESNEFKKHTSAAENRAYEAEDKVSKMLVDRMSSVRKQERLSLLAANAVCAGHLRRCIGVSILRWAQLATWSRYHRMHGLRIQRRGERQGVFKHFREWSTFIRQSKRYERLGFGADGLRRRMTLTVLAEWRTELKLSRKVREQQIRNDQMNMERPFDAWANLAQQRKQIQRLSIRAFLYQTMSQGGMILSAWHEYVRSKQEKLKRNRVLDGKYWIHSEQSAFKVWRDATAERRRHRQIVQKCTRRMENLDEHAAFQRWSSLTKSGRHVRIILKNALMGTDLMKKHHFVELWRRRTVDLRALRLFSQRMRHHGTSAAFRGWSYKSKILRRQRGIIGRAVSSTDYVVKRQAMHQFRHFTRVRRLLRRIAGSLRYHDIYGAFHAWSDVARDWSARVRALSQKLCIWVCRICFRAWHKYRSFASWSDKILPKLVTRTDTKILTDSFEVWAILSRDLKIMRRAINTLLKLRAKKALHSWQDVSVRTKVMQRRIQLALRAWMLKCVRGSFTCWRRAHVMMRARHHVFQQIERRTDLAIRIRSFNNWCRFRQMNRIRRQILIRFKKKKLVKVVNSWAAVCAYKLALIKTAEKTLLKWLWKSSRGRTRPACACLMPQCIVSLIDSNVMRRCVRAVVVDDAQIAHSPISCAKNPSSGGL